VLERTPVTLRAMLGGSSEFWTHGNYGPDTFSPFDVVGHLLHGERTDWMTRVRMILEHGEAKPFPAFDRFAMYETSKGKSMRELLDAFEDARRENLTAFRALDLSRDSLGLRGRHPALGSVTLQQLLATWVVHDLTHIRQIVRGMAFQYREEVGPWKQYLSILPQEGE
jgi:hypothetical protein